MEKLTDQQLETLIHAMITIGNFQDPEEIRAIDIGLSYEEHLEMAYENMKAVATHTIEALGLEKNHAGTSR